MNGRIVEGCTVLAPNAEAGGEMQEALACGPVEDGDIQVRFTTGKPGKPAREHTVSASKVTWVCGPW